MHKNKSVLAHLELVGAACAYLAQSSAFNSSENSTVTESLPIGADLELLLTLRAIRHESNEEKTNPMAPFLFTDFELKILRLVVASGKLTAKQIASRLRYEDGDDGIVNGLDAAGEPKPRLKMALARFKQLSVLVEEGGGFWSVSTILVSLVPALSEAAKKNNSDAE